MSYFHTSDTTKCGGRLAVSEFITNSCWRDHFPTKQRNRTVAQLAKHAGTVQTFVPPDTESTDTVMSCLTSACVQRTGRRRLCLRGCVHDHDHPLQQVLLLLHRRVGLTFWPSCHPAVIQTSAEHWSLTISRHVARWHSSHPIPPPPSRVNPAWIRTRTSAEQV